MQWSTMYTWPQIHQYDRKYDDLVGYVPELYQKSKEAITNTLQRTDNIPQYSVKSGSYVSRLIVALSLSITDTSLNTCSTNCKSHSSEQCGTQKLTLDQSGHSVISPTVAHNYKEQYMYAACMCLQRECIYTHCVCAQCLCVCVCVSVCVCMCVCVYVCVCAHIIEESHSIWALRNQ